MQAARIFRMKRARLDDQMHVAQHDVGGAQPARIAGGQHQLRHVALHAATGMRCLALQIQQRRPLRLQLQLARVAIDLEESPIARLLVQRAADAQVGRHRSQHELAPVEGGLLPVDIIGGDIPLFTATAHDQGADQHLIAGLRLLNIGNRLRLALPSFVHQPADAQQHDAQQQRDARQNEEFEDERA